MFRVDNRGHRKNDIIGIVDDRINGRIADDVEIS